MKSFQCRLQLEMNVLQDKPRRGAVTTTRHVAVKALGSGAIVLLSFAASAAPGAASCGSLMQLKIDNTTITSAQYLSTPEGGQYCEVAATVAPQHDIKMRLPETWKGRYVQYGGGGFDGSIPNLSVPSSPMVSTSKDPVNFGFAVIASNGGHRNTEYAAASFSVDRGLTLSYATAKMYDTDLVGRTLVKAYYGRDAKFHYFAGCSNGGKNASVVASNFGDYYDGVIGGDGVWGHADDDVKGADMPGLTAKWSRTVQLGIGLSRAKGDALYEKAIEACDALDGVKDGLISNVEACPFKQIARSMQCQSGSGESCLTEGEISNIDAHASELVLDGKVIGAPWSRAGNFGKWGNVVALPSGFLQMAFRRPTAVDPLSFDIPTQFAQVKTVLDDVYNMTGDQAGIVKYLKKGKKLMLFHGWEDMEVPPYTSLNFYKSLRRVEPNATHKNAKLYMVPGMPHCRGGRGADASELLHVMAKWVEEGVEPGSYRNPVIAWERPNNDNTGPQGVETATFSRPLCAYPEYPAYSGRGDPISASSYSCRQGPGRAHDRDGRDDD